MLHRYLASLKLHGALPDCKALVLGCTKIAQRRVETLTDQALDLQACLAREIRRHRDRQGLSAQRLADLVAAAGGKLTRQAISKIETGGRDVRMDEVAVLARALRVPPVLLLFPLGVAPSVDVFPPEPTVPTWQAVRWFTGDAHLDGSDISTDPGAAPAVLWRRHQKAVDEALEAIRRGKAMASVSSHSGPPAPAESEVLPGLSFTDWLPEHRREVDDRLRAVQSIRREIRRFGLTPDALPEVLAPIDPQA
jgi:transcriptional regulator with XRE-family HTH domain